VATELRRRDGSTVVMCPGSGVIAGMLRRRRLTVHTGPLVSVQAPALGASRRRLDELGALAVDMESAWLAGAAGGRALAVVRVILDTPERGLNRPVATLAGFRRPAR